MYLQLLSPNFIVEVGTDHDVAYNEGLTIFDSPMLFSYTFRNEIWLLIKNNFDKVQTIQANKKTCHFFCSTTATNGNKLRRCDTRI